MRIIELTESLAAGGAETFVVRISNSLAAAGHQVTIAVMSPVIHPGIVGVIEPGVRIEFAPSRGWRWLLRAERIARMLRINWRPQDARQARWLKRLIRTFRPDVIHSHLLKSDLLGADVRRFAPDVRQVMTTHGDYRMYLEGRSDPFVLGFDKRVNALVHSVDAIVGVARDHLDLFRNYFPQSEGKLHLIYNGYPASADTETSRMDVGIPKDKFIFGMVARGIEGKGWNRAIEAFFMLNRDDAALILVGEGPALERLRNEINDPRIIFTGFSPRPLDFVRNFDVGLLPSEISGESLPTSVIEYLACGKPVIATDVGEVRYMLRYPQNPAGILLAFENECVNPTELAEAMRTMMNDLTRRNQFVGATSQAFAQFEMGNCVRLYEALFQ